MTREQATLRGLDPAQAPRAELLQEATSANDRIKYLLTLLQLARSHADHPDAPVYDLRAERRQCGLDESALDHVVQASFQRYGRLYYIPMARRLLKRVHADLEVMIRPFGAADAATFTERLAALNLPSSSVDPDTISGRTIDVMTAAAAGADSLHLLLMDVHRALDRLAATAAAEHGESPSPTPA